MADFPYRERLAAGVAATVRRQRTIADLNVPLPAVAVDAWNARYPIATPVTAYPGVRPDEFPRVDCTVLTTRTRSKAQVLGGHTAVVWVDGHSACIALTHVDVDLPRLAADLRAKTPPEPLADALREQRHLLLDADPDWTVHPFVDLHKHAREVRRA